MTLLTSAKMRRLGTCVALEASRLNANISQAWISPTTICQYGPNPNFSRAYNPYRKYYRYMFHTAGCVHTISKHQHLARSISSTSKFAFLEPSEADRITLNNVTPAKTIVTTTQDRQSQLHLERDLTAREEGLIYDLEAQQEEREHWQEQVDEALDHPDYVPAESWDGLEIVGGEKEWDTGKQFYSFSTTAKLRSREEVTVAIHRALVETLALKALREPIGLTETYQEGPLLSDAANVQIRVVEDTGLDSMVYLEYPNKETESAVLAVASGNGQQLNENPSSSVRDVTQQRTPVDYSLTTAECQTLIVSWGDSWHHVPLHDPEFKLALVKRILKLTGLKASDPIIHRSQTVGALLTGLAKPTPPKRLHAILNTQQGLTELSNVHILPRRRTVRDQDREVGRAKVIKRVLEQKTLLN